MLRGLRRLQAHARHYRKYNKSGIAGGKGENDTSIYGIKLDYNLHFGILEQRRFHLKQLL